MRTQPPKVKITLWNFSRDHTVNVFSMLILLSNYQQNVDVRIAPVFEFNDMNPGNVFAKDVIVSTVSDKNI